MVRKTIKGSVVSDFCAENPVEGEDAREDFLDEDILYIEDVFQWSCEPIWEWDRSTLNHSRRVSHTLGS